MPAAPNPLQLLAARRFLPLFLAQFLGAFNDNLFKNAIVVLILFRLAPEAGLPGPVLVTAAAGLFIIPFVLFSALAGQLADRYDKALLIRITKFAEIAVMALGAGAFAIGSPAVLLAVLTLMGLQSAIFGPLKYGILPVHLQPGELVAGNALIEASTFLAILAGTIAGSLTVLAEGGIIIVSAAMIAVAVLGAAASLLIPPAPAADPALRLDFNVLSGTTALVREAMGHRTIRLSILGISWFWGVGALFIGLFPVLARDVMGGGESVVTLFLVVFTAGIGIGSMWCGRALGREITARPVPFAAIAIAIACLAVGLAAGGRTPAGPLADALAFAGDPGNWTVLAGLFALALAGGWFVVPLYAIVQHRAAPERKSRTIAALNIVSALFMAAAAGLSALALAGGLSAASIFLLAGAAGLVVAWIVVALLPREVAQAVLQRLFRLAFHVEIRGLENIAAAGKRAVILPNHTSFLDAPLLAAFLPGRPVFAIDQVQARQWYARLATTLVDTFAIDPASPFATKAMIREVERDRHCVIFPEGRITTTSALMKIYPGPALIADRAGAAVVPVRIEGAQYSRFSRLAGTLRQRLFPRITITVLPPRRLSAPAELRGRARRALLADQLYDIMSAMMAETGNRERTLFTALLDARATHGGSAEILEDTERKPLTYDRLVLASLILGRRIAALTQPGEIVGLMLPTAAGAAAAFFGLAAFGRVPAMLNFTTGAAGMQAACRAAGITLVLTSSRFIERAHLEAEAEALGKTVRLIPLEEVRAGIGGAAKARGLLDRARARAVHAKSGGRPEDPAVVLFTSGSEGAPKGVVLTHRNLVANCLQAASRIDFNPRDRVFNALPIFHSFGLTGGLLLPLLSGVRCFVYPSPLHYRIIAELVYGTNSTIMFGTDTFLAGYARVAHPYDFYRIRYVFAGAEKVREETRRIWMERFGVRLLEGYGATECSPVIALNTPMHNKPGTVGRLLPGIEHRLEPVEGIEEGGRLFVRGPNVMAGYLEVSRPGVIRRLEEGWHDTGDIVAIDERGFVRILGRAKRFAKIAGEMVSLAAVEELAAGTWPEARHAAIALPDPRRGQQVVLVTDAAGATRAAMQEAARAAGHPELFVPREVVVVAAVPALATGKPDYKAVEAMLAAPQARQEAKA